MNDGGQPLLRQTDRLDRCDRWVALHFARPRPVLSSAVVNGGLTVADRWLNLKVSGDICDNRTPPAATVAALCAHQGWHGDTVAMMTAAAMNSLRIRHDYIDGQLVLVAVTTGLSNARRVGDPAEYRHLAEPVTLAGTINLAVVVDMQLAPAVMVEALMAVTEAKTAALHQRSIRSPVSGGLATGTGTDAVAIFASDTGPRADYAGKHTILGEMLGRLALAAIGDSIDMTGDDKWEMPLVSALPQLSRGNAGTQHNGQDSTGLESAGTPTQEPGSENGHVGWVERSDTHHSPGTDGHRCAPPILQTEN